MTVTTTFANFLGELQGIVTASLNDILRALLLELAGPDVSEYERTARCLSSLEVMCNSVNQKIESQEILLRHALNDATPIGRLPVEVLVRIIGLHLDSYTEYPLAYHDHRTALTLVSTKFNTVVQNTASFWTYIGAGFSSTLIQKSLDRSRDLFLHVRSFDTDDGVSKDAVECLWEALSPVPSRLRTVCGTASARMTPIAFGAPNLETLDILQEQSDDGNPVLYSTSFLAPNLKELRLAGPFEEETHLIVTIQRNTFPNLRLLKLWDLGGVTLDDVFGIIGPSLEELSLRNIKWNDPWVLKYATPDLTTSVPNLQVLSLVGLEEVEINVILNVLNPQYCTSLDLRPQTPLGTFKLDEVPQFVVLSLKTILSAVIDLRLSLSGNTTECFSACENICVTAAGPIGQTFWVMCGYIRNYGRHCRLSIDVYDDIPSTDLIDYLKLLPCKVNLRLLGSPTWCATLLAALGQLPTHNNIPWLLPQLCKLRVGLEPEHEPILIAMLRARTSATGPPVTLDSLDLRLKRPRPDLLSLARKILNHNRVKMVPMSEADMMDPGWKAL